jgi:hypothetical protein
MRKRALFNFVMPRREYRRLLPVLKREELLPEVIDNSIMAWIGYTWLVLRDYVPVSVSTRILPDAINIVQIIDLSYRLLRGEGYNEFLVIVHADKAGIPYDMAKVNIVQNPVQACQPNAFFIPHWPQPGLVKSKSGPVYSNQYKESQCNHPTFNHVGSQTGFPLQQCQSATNGKVLGNTALQKVVADYDTSGSSGLNNNAGNTFRVGYMGMPRNIYKGINYWKKKLGNGIQFIPKGPGEWHDYSDIDAVLAVRGFYDQSLFNRKPPSKLVNAWIAGVPFIGGPESAYLSAGRENHNWICAESTASAVNWLYRLKNNKLLYDHLVHNGRRSAACYNRHMIVKKWLYLLDNCMRHFESHRIYQAEQAKRRAAFVLKRMPYYLRTVLGKTRRATWQLIS